MRGRRTSSTLFLHSSGYTFNHHRYDVMYGPYQHHHYSFRRRGDAISIMTTTTTTTVMGVVGVVGVVLLEDPCQALCDSCHCMFVEDPYNQLSQLVEQSNAGV